MTRWVTPAFCVVTGVAVFVAWWAGGQFETGLAALAVMVGVGVLLIPISHRSETLRGLLDRRDERIVNIDMRSTAVAGLTVITAVIVAFLVQIAEGHSGAHYSWLGALAGLAYLASLAWSSWRG
jgi:hypothetical protein